MARIEVSAAAAEDLARLTVTHSLPTDTNERIKRSVRSLARFPRLGTRLTHGGWEGLRVILGPWRWMIIVYDDEQDDRVVIVTIQDGRSSASAPASR